MTRDSEAARKRHHELSQAILKRQAKNAQQLSFSYQENYIINLVTKAVMLETIKQDICLIEEVGVAKMDIFKNVSKHFGNNAKGSAANLVCIFKKCTCSNINYNETEGYLR